ncbi:hypothetical protein [Bacteroides rodentium]|uniref:hypothetical protein n=1 Tax=Bacteroides rodentium TaxID=691816 RepID=UPI001FCBFA5D|nr:hypothetical protein [Bacteroides rodentium]
MKTEIVGRIREQKALMEYMDSKESEFIAIYGRRRVGKTFLVREMLGDSFAFYVTGVDNVSMQEQLLNFNLALRKSSGKEWTIAPNWLLAFDSWLPIWIICLEATRLFSWMSCLGWIRISPALSVLWSIFGMPGLRRAGTSS